VLGVEPPEAPSYLNLLAAVLLNETTTPTPVGAIFSARPRAGADWDV
jgi:hypothetical protein